MTKPIVLSEPDWATLRQRLMEDYGRGVMLIRSRMRDRLGFVDREHRWYDIGVSRYRTHVCLDFYNESKQTMFLLKYSDYLDKSRITES